MGKGGPVLSLAAGDAIPDSGTCNMYVNPRVLSRSARLICSIQYLVSKIQATVSLCQHH